MKVYLSLPISGYDEKERWKYAARMSAVLAMMHEDWHVVNPFHVRDRLQRKKYDETGVITLPSYDEMMKADIEELRKCDLALFCPGWYASEGCREEMRECWWHGIGIAFLSADGKVYGEVLA